MMFRAEPPDPATIRSALLEQILAFGGDLTEQERAELRVLLEREVDGAGPEGLAHLAEHIVKTGSGWTYFPPDDLARSIQRVISGFLVTDDSTLEGIENLAALGDRPALFLSNHLSYADANLFGVLLDRTGFAPLARRLTVVAGPKVYSALVRRFSSLCFGTIKTPQSSALSTEDAVMSARDVAKVARETIALARDRLASGDALLVFIEGTRSRTGGMQRALPAVVRYFEPKGAPLVPLAITGSERFMPVGHDTLHRSTVRVRVGKPVDAEELLTLADGNRRVAIDAVGLAVASLLPEQYRGAYAGSDDELAPARDVAERVFGSDPSPG